MRSKQTLSINLSRRKILKRGIYGGLATSLAPALWVSGCSKLRRKKIPNVILIVIDTMRADHTGCYGYQRNVTPNIDRLARDGILFKKAIVAAPWTLPSVASILTSQYPCVLGVYDKLTVIDSRFPLFSEIFKQHNYTTHGIVSHTLMSARFGLGRGFDHYDEESTFCDEGISSPTVTSKAISFLQQSHKQPFFLLLHYFDPHYNYTLHKQYNYFPSYNGNLKSGHPMMELWRIRHQLSENDIKFLLSLYDSEIAFTDEYIGKLLNELKKLGLYDNSIIIVTSDHGEEFMERGWIGHTRTLHQELLWVPLIIRLPAGGAQVVKQPIGLIDIMPTILKYFGWKIPDGLEGQTLNLCQCASIASRPIFSETFNPQLLRILQQEPVRPIAYRSIILDNWKYIYDQQSGSEQIYDLSEDPYEKNNLSEQQTEQHNGLKALLSNWIKYVKTKEKQGSSHDASELFTPEQRKHLESLGYL
ncbi:MAG: sulfatase [Planctomycetota bacterium]